jgi:hypothetical protein
LGPSYSYVVGISENGAIIGYSEQNMLP